MKPKGQSGLPVWLAAVTFFSIGIAPSLAAQSGAAGVAELTVDRIYSLPSLSGRLTRGLQWAPDGKRLSYFEIRGSGKETKTELWTMDAASGQRQLLVPAEKLESVMPAEKSRPSQSTGLGRRAPSEYQWAPDGQGILLEGPTALAWLDLKSLASRPLVNGESGISDPKISPDGKWVSFVRQHNLWAVALADGTEHAVTAGGSEALRKGELDWVYPEELEAKTAYWWSPDSLEIAYLEMDESRVSEYPMVDFSSPRGEAERERYPVAGGANPVVRVFVVPFGGGTARLLDTGSETDNYIPRVSWLRDSKRVAIQRLNREQTRLELLLADAGTGNSGVLLTESDPDWVNLGDDLYFFKDGERFLWSSERSGHRHLYLYDLQGKLLRQLTRGEWEVTALDGVDEAKGLVYFTSTEKSPLERHFYRVGLNGNSFARLTREPGTHGAVLAPGGSSFYDTYSNSSTPPRQELWSSDGPLVASINENQVSELKQYRLSPVQFFTVKSRDGVELHASMIKPPDFDPRNKYPVLVYTYGGPHAQVVRDGWGGAVFLWHQLMASKGYIIFSVDNRGSAGRGHGFERPLHLRLGQQELSDQVDGVHYLKSLPFVDGNRVGVWGWSYGGHMTLHLMFEAAEEFKAGFAGGPVTDWRYYDSIYTERYLGLPQNNPKGYEDSSPVKYASRLQGKLLIAHGTGDDNVHFANTLALVNTLIEAGKYVEVLPFPGRGHGVSDLPARRVLMKKVTQFFQDNL